jgi:hypothetical protein
VALLVPTLATTRAKAAGCRHDPVRSARTVRPIIQGSAANGSRIAEIRIAMVSR